MEPIKINLATFEYQDKRLSYPVMLAAALIVVALSVLSIRSGINKQGEIREYENRLATREQSTIKRQQIKSDAVKRLKDGDIAALEKDIDFINSLIMTDTYPYDRLLNSLELCVPKGIVLSALKMSKDMDMVILNGSAGSMDEVSDFLDSLNSSKIFTADNLLSLSMSREDTVQGVGAASPDDGITFEIGCAINEDEIWSK